MVKQVNIHAAKTHFSQLVEEVEAGAEVIVARAGKPVLKLVKLESKGPTARQLGFMRAQIEIPDMEAFLNSDSEVAALFNSDKGLV
jgi:prevent-host-death family protein